MEASGGGKVPPPGFGKQGQASRRKDGRKEELSLGKDIQLHPCIWHQVWQGTVPALHSCMRFTQATCFTSSGLGGRGCPSSVVTTIGTSS
jgi:hypothetical protein